MLHEVAVAKDSTLMPENLTDKSVKLFLEELSSSAPAPGGGSAAALSGALGASLLRDRLVDEVHWFMAARFLGVEGRPALGGLGLRRLADAPALTDVRVRRVGPDLYLRGRVEDRSGGNR